VFNPNCLWTLQNISMFFIINNVWNTITIWFFYFYKLWMLTMHQMNKRYWLIILAENYNNDLITFSELRYTGTLNNNNTFLVLKFLVFYIIIWSFMWYLKSKIYDTKEKVSGMLYVTSYPDPSLCSFIYLTMVYNASILNTQVIFCYKFIIFLLHFVCHGTYNL